MDKRKLRTYKKCDKCNDSISVQNFKRHYNTCKGILRNRSCRCPYCDAILGGIKDYYLHVENCKSKYNLPLNSLGRIKAVRRDRYCKFCNRFFENSVRSSVSNHEACCISNPSRRPGSWKGKKHKDSTKIKMAEAARKRLGPNFRGFYSRKACDFIENLNQNFDVNFQHQLNGGEVQVGPYFLDGYDVKRNIVFEYNEPFHYQTAEKIEKDTYRRNYILEKLNCRFLAFNEELNVFEEYSLNNEVKVFKDFKDIQC